MRFYSHKVRENIYNLANGLTVSRMLMTPIIGNLIIVQDYHAALGLLTVAGITDVLDGYVARRWNQKTSLGSILDPAADKFLMTVLTVTLMQSGAVPVGLGSLILLRDVGLTGATAYYRYLSLPQKTFKQFFDMSLPLPQVSPPTISKLNTLFQLILMGLSVAGSAYGFLDHYLMDSLRYLVGLTTIWSGAHYFWMRDKLIKITKIQ
ncbi:CDP-alcohol phosphatidyltransferase-domain-containing protein [Gorgonomyces haynaldii]|nr:CDP-alcohol phosphatidyltransferase-domain-containing protein [Gorgonomyces haynaldii]